MQEQQEGDQPEEFLPEQADMGEQLLSPGLQSPAIQSKSHSIAKEESMQMIRPNAVNKKKKNKFAPPPSIFDLISHLELANSQPNMAQVALANVAGFCNEIIEKERDHQLAEHFAPNKSPEETVELIEGFMQNCQLLIDNSREHQKLMLTILAKLSVIKFADFGDYCFKTLIDSSNTSDELEQIVLEIIKQEIILAIKDQAADVERLSVKLLQGILEFVEETENTEMLADLYSQCFPSWLKTYCNKIDELKKKKQKMGDNEHYDAIIGLISKSLDENKDNVELCQDKGCEDYIAKIMNVSTATDARYIPILQAVARLANQDSEIADYFIDQKCHNALIKQIKGSFKNGLKDGHFSLYAEDSTEPFSKRKKRYMALAAEIVTLGGLLQADSQENRMKILKDPSEITLDIISIMNHEKTDPILLQAICTFALDLFECEDLKGNEEFMKPWSDRMNFLLEMIPYLGGAKYQDLLVMTRQYQKGDQVGNKMTESGAFELTKITHKPPVQDDKSIDEAEAEEQLEALIWESLKKLEDTLASELFISVINLMIYFCTEADNKINDVHVLGNNIFDSISESLNNNGREDALFKSLAIPNDDVKLAVVKCLFVVPLDELDIDEIRQIVAIVSNCKSISSGKTELVLSTVYWIKFKLANEEVVPGVQGAGRTFQENFGQMSVQYALDFLLENSARISNSEDDDVEKYTLSMSILNFLKCASDAPLMQEHMRDKDIILKQILMQEDVYSSQTIKEVPIDIETTMMGRQIQCLIDCISGNDTLEAYSDVSLRIFMRMADVLMYQHFCPFCVIETKDDPPKKLEKKQKKIYMKKKRQEMNFWVDCPMGFYQHCLKNDQQREELQKQHYNFTQANGVSLLKMFLTSKYPINETYIQKLCDPCFTDITSKSLADHIADKRAKLEFTFKSQYVGNKKDEQSMYLLRQTMMTKELQKQIGSKENEEKGPSKEELVDEKNEKKSKSRTDMSQEERIQEAQIQYHKNKDYRTRDAPTYSYNQKLQSLELGEELMKTQVAQPKQSKAEIQSLLLAEVAEEQNAKLSDPESTETLTLKEERKDGFLNEELRCLTVAAFLRCLFAAIEYAPDYNMRQTAIDNLSDQSIFRSITQLCDSTDWNEECHIGAKYLRVMRYVIKIPIDRDIEKIDKLVHYEIMAMVIQKCLAKIVDKMDKGMELTNGDVVSNYEISLTLFTVLQQTNNYVFSELDLYKQHLEKEARIAHEVEKKRNKNFEGVVKKWPELIKQTENGPWQKKCQYIQPTHGKKQLTKFNYTVQLKDIKKKRTIQAKIVEFMVLQLFSVTSINSLLDILFNDMKGDYKDLLGEMVDPEDSQKRDQSESEEEEGDHETEEWESGEEQSEEDVLLEHDETRNGVDIEEYISLKGTLTIERIKDIVGQLMSSCEGKLKYEIMLNLMRGVIFNGKPLRESFLQEILDAESSATYKVALEKYMNQQGMTCVQFFHDKDPKFIEMLKELYEQDPQLFQSIYQQGKDPKKDPKFKIEKVHERVLELCDTEINNYELEHIMLAEKDKLNPDHHTGEPDINYYDRVFVLTNYGVQILKKLPDEIACEDCLFCPRGPIQEWCIKYQSIETIINFPQQPQKLVIFYNVKKFDDKDHLVEIIRFQLTLKMQTFTKASKVYQTLMQAMSKIEVMKTQQNKKVEGLQEKIYNTTNIDRLVSFELQHFIHQIPGLESVSKKKIKDVQLIYCQYLFTNIISEKFFEEHVKDQPDKKAQISQKNKQMNGGRCKPYVSSLWDEESELNIVDNVLVTIISGHIVIFKEKWENWVYREIEDLIRYKKKQRSDLNNGKGVWEFFDRQIPQKDNSILERNEIISKYCVTNLFQLVSLIDINQIQKGIVHSGENATVEIVIDDEHYIVLDFTGDMERQSFCSQFIDFIDGNDKEDVQVTAGEDEEEDDEDDENKKENSDTEDLNIKIYD